MKKPLADFRTKREEDAFTKYELCHLKNREINIEVNQVGWGTSISGKGKSKIIIMGS